MNSNPTGGRTKVLFLVEGHTDIRFVTGLASVCDLTLVVPARPFRSSGLDNRIREAGVSIPIHEIRGGRVSFQARSLLWLFQNARQFDVILTQELLRGTLNANMASLIRHVPVVANILVPATEYFRCRRERKQVGWFTAFCGELVIRMLLTVNGRVVARCAAWGPYLQSIARKYSDRVVAGHYYGVDTRAFRPATPQERLELRRRHQLPENKFLVLFPSRISHEKDPESALKAVALLRRLGVDAVILNLGGGYEAFLRMAAEMGLPQCNEWVLGRPAMHPMRELADYFRAADVICQSSLEEGLSLATMEGMACGVPVVASDVGGMASHLRDHAWMVPRRNPEAMSRAFFSIHQSPVESTAKALLQRAWIESNYSREIAFEHWRALFAGVAAERKRPGNQ